MRLLPTGSRAILVELADGGETQALFAALGAEPLPGVAEIVPAARTLLLRFAPGHAIDRAGIAAELARHDLSAAPAPNGEEIEIPVLYDGEDLPEVAKLTGLTEREVIARHAAPEYSVAFTGFAPGFAYLSGGDPALNVPRRKSPRTRIPPESVAIAGAFSGIYPRASPGGWQILGRTPLRMFDPAREPAILLRPGARVRFRPLADEAEFAALVGARPAPAIRAEAVDGPRLRVEAASLPALYQDEGRPGRAKDGLSVSGALDRASLFAANRLVGNPRGAAALELAAPITLVSDDRAVLALAGAAVRIAVEAGSGERLRVAAGRPFAVEPGDRILVGAPQAGARAYLAARGGFHVKQFFGSASADTLAGIGPEPVVAGAVLRIASGPTEAVADEAAMPVDAPRSGEIVVLDIVLGPRDDWFAPASLHRFLAAEWTVSPRSNRIGLRLEGPNALERLDPAAELPSEGTVRGAIQIPHDGQPVLFLADHPVTGGYPVVGVVADHHLDRAGQIPPGARIRFRALKDPAT